MARTPIFIFAPTLCGVFMNDYGKRKTDKELHEEWERDRRRRMMAEAKREEAERKKREEQIHKLLKRVDEEIAAEEEYYKAVGKNPWDFQFLPEGWSPFGQWYFPIITEYYFPDE